MYKYLEFSGRKNWATIYNGEHFLYVQYNNDWDTFSISTVHKPSTRNGTGFQLVGEHDGISHNSIIDTIKKRFGTVPNWAIHEDTTNYEDEKDFLAYEKKFWKDAHFVDDTLENIIKNISNSILQCVNCSGYCQYCNIDKIHYGIHRGSFVYYCNECKKEIAKADIQVCRDNRFNTSKTLGELLEDKNDTIKRNAMSILKTLNN